MLRQLRVKINGDVWRVRYLKTKTFNAAHGAHRSAVTWYDHKKGKRFIDFKCSDFCLSHVRHEVMHAYLSYRDFVKKGYGEIEEMVAETYGAKENAMRNTWKFIWGAFK